MAMSGIPADIIQLAKRSLEQDPRPNDDLENGRYFDDPQYLDSLRRSSVEIICAIQQEAGESRPAFALEQSLASWTAAKRLGSVEKFENAVALAILALRYMPPDHNLRPAANFHFGQLLEYLWKRHSRPSDLDQCIRHYKNATEFAEVAGRPIALWYRHYFWVLKTRYTQSHGEHDAQDANNAIDRNIELSRQQEKMFLAGALSDKANFLVTIAALNQEGAEPYLLEAISCLREAIALEDEELVKHPGNPPIAYESIYTYALDAYLALVRLTKDEKYSLEAIRLAQHAQKAYPAAGEHYKRLNASLCHAFLVRWDVLSSAPAVDPVWKDYAAANRLNADVRVKIAHAWDARAVQAQSLERNDIVIGLLNNGNCVLDDIIQARPRILEDYPDMEFVMAAKGSLLHTHFKTSGELKQLSMSILCYEMAVKLSKAPLEHCLVLTDEFITRFRLTNDRGDTEKAVEYARQALVYGPPDLPEMRGQCLRAIGRALNAHFENLRESRLAAEAIAVLEEATTLIPRREASLAFAFNDLGNAYRNLHTSEDASANLAKSVRALTSGIDVLREQLPRRVGAADDLKMLYNSLGHTMLQRYALLHLTDDLASCWNYFRQAVEGVNRDDPIFASRVSNYVYSCGLRFEQSGERGMLTDADRMIEEALGTARPISAHLVYSLHNHRGILNLRLAMADDEDHAAKLDKAISSFQKALKTPNLERILRATTLMDLGVALGERARATTIRGDFEDALRQFEAAADMVPGDDAIRWLIKFNHANSHHYIFKNFGLGWGSEFGKLAAEAYAELALDKTVPPNERLRSAEAAATLNRTLGNATEARRFGLLALDALPDAISSSATRLEQLRLVRQYRQLPSTVAALALDAGTSPSDAIRYFESGRAFLWNRLLIQSSPLDDLARAHPDLAANLQAARSALAIQSNPQARLATAGTLKDITRIERENAWRQCEEAVKKVRATDGFKDFMRLPAEESCLENLATDAPVVFINAHEYRSDALIVTKSKVFSTQLPLFTMSDIKYKAAEIMWAMDALQQGGQESAAMERFDSVMAWLWDVAARPVLDSIDLSAYQRSKIGKPRVIWVTTGWMNLFPIHAAGRYDHSSEKTPPSTATCVHDLVVSTYTTSLRALSYARERVAALKLKRLSIQPTERERMLLVAMKTTKGERDLDNAPEEVRIISDALNPVLECTVKLQPDVETVKSELHKSGIVYFSCHSEAHRRDPSLSAILLERSADSSDDAPPTRLTVRNILATDPVPDCRLVVLSSCESGASKDLFLTEEGLSIAGAFHMAGVPHSVSGMWQLDDTVAMEVGVALFNELLRGGEWSGAGVNGAQGLDQIAVALHTALQRQRDKGTRTMLWASFIHTGC